MAVRVLGELGGFLGGFSRDRASGALWTGMHTHAVRTATRPARRRSPIVAIAAAGVTMMAVAASIDADAGSEEPATTVASRPVAPSAATTVVQP